MGTFLALIGFIGFFVFIIMAIVGAIKKNGKGKKRLLIAIVCSVLLIIGVIIAPSTESDIAKTANNKKEKTVAVPKNETNKNKEQKKDSQKEGTRTSKTVTAEVNKQEKKEAENAKKTRKNDSRKEKKDEETKKEIETSVFKYAKSVEVTNALEINKHVTVFVQMAESLSPGMATQHVVNQTYDFLQQKDIEGAKTVSINVKQGDKKIAMFTVEKDKFKPNDDEPMSDSVMKAAKIEFMTPEVKEYGKTMNSW